MLLLCAASVAVAQPDPTPAPPPETPPELTDEAKLELAKKHYAEAHEAHTSGRYADAATGYLKANELYPKPLFIYNAAIAFRLNGDKKEALEHYQRYLELEPDGKGADAAKKYVALLTDELKKPEKPVEGDGKKPVEEKKPPEIEVPEESEPLPIVTRESIEARGSGKRVAGLVMSGVGVALLGAGIGFGIHARSLSNEASDYQGPAGDELDDLYSRGDAADRNMIVLLSAGALTTVAGGVVYFLGIRDRSRAERDLELFATPTSVGVSGRF